MLPLPLLCCKLISLRWNYPFGAYIQWNSLLHLVQQGVPNTDIYLYNIHQQLSKNIMLASYFLPFHRIIALPQSTNYHRFWFHTYLRWNVSPLCRFAAAARLPMLTSIQHFAIHRKCKSGEIIDLLACRFIAQRHRKRQGHVFCTFAQLNKMTSNSPQWRKCGEAAKVWSQH